MLRNVIVCLWLIALLCSVAFATEIRTGNTVSVGANEVIDDDLFASGQSVFIAGQVRGDVFAFGQTVRITGPVEGSVMAAGQSLQITDTVGGSVRAAGQSVTLSSTVRRNAALAGQELVVMPDVRIGRDLHAAGQSVELAGRVGRRASLAAQAVTVRGQIGEDLSCDVERLALTATARVARDLIYRSRYAATVEPGARVGGRTEHLPPLQRGRRAHWRGWGFGGFLFMLMVFVAGVVGLAVLPRLVGSAADAMTSRPWWNLLLGFIALVVVPIGFLIVCLTVIGIPLAMLVLALWGAALAFSGVPVGIFLGRWIMARFGARAISPYLALLIGLVVLTVVGLIPYLGGLIKFATILFGLGVYTRAIGGLLGEMRKQPAGPQVPAATSPTA